MIVLKRGYIHKFMKGGIGWIIMKSFCKECDRKIN